MTVSLPDLAVEDVSAKTFKSALRHLSGGVAVIATGSGADRGGLTATSASALSAEPPTVVVCVNKTASALPTLLRERSFSINILSGDQQVIAERFSGKDGIKGAQRFEGSDWAPLATGAPVLVGALAALDCELEEVIERHSHAILIGRVKATTVGDQEEALLYWRGDYRHLSSVSV